MLRIRLTCVCWLAAIGGAPAQTLIERATFKGDTIAVNRTALSPDGRIFAGRADAGGADSRGGEVRGGEIKLWDAVTGREIGSLTGFSGYLSALVFSPDGKLLAAAGDRAVQIWDVKTRQPLASRVGRDYAPISTLAFSNSSRKLASADWRDAMICDVATGKQLTFFKRQTLSNHRTAFSKDLKTLAVPNYREIELWDVSTGKQRGILSEHRGEVGFLEYSADDKLLIAASTYYTGPGFKWKGDVKLWDAVKEQEAVGFKAPFGQILDAALSPDGKTLALLDSPEIDVDPDLKLVNVATGRQTIIPSESSYSLTAVYFTREGKLFVTGTPDDKMLKLWELSYAKGRTNSGTYRR
jgi:WD40 repeat protein